MKKQQHGSKSRKIFRIGKWVLQYPQNHQKRKPIHQKVMQQLKNQQELTLDLSCGKFTRYKWKKILRYIKKSPIQRILSAGNSDNDLLKSISRVPFCNLKELDLRQCNLSSVEQIISGPYLEFLSLMQNNITSLNQLKKCQFRNLKTLLLNNNPLRSLSLQRCNFTLETYWLQRKYNTRTIKQCLGQTSVFKLKSQTLKDIAIQSQERIYQPKCIEKINEKYLLLEKLYFIDPETEQFGSNQFIAYISDSDQDALAIENIVQEETLKDMNIPTALHYIQGNLEEDWLQDEMEQQMEQQMEQLKTDSQAQEQNQSQIQEGDCRLFDESQW